MNIPFQPSDLDSTEILSIVAPPTAFAGAGQSTWIDVRGYNWIEFVIDFTAQQNVTKLFALIEIDDPTGITRPLRVEDISPTTGVAPHVTYAPEILTPAATPWGIPVPVNGTRMRVDIKGDIAAGTDRIAIRALRRF